jgi:hypothetical protein
LAARPEHLNAPMPPNRRPEPRRSPRLLLAVLAGLLTLALSPRVAIAEHGGRPIGALFGCDRPVTPPRCTSVADNPRHLVFFDETLTPELAEAMRGTMADDYGATELVVIEQSRLTRATDVIAFSQDYGENGAAGWVYCPPDAPQGTNPVGDRWCRQQELHLNLNFRYGAFFADAGSRDHVTCHEMGHTIGLRHWGNPPQTSGADVGATCMNANTPNGPTSLHQFDVDHINAYAYRQRPSVRIHPLLAPTDAPRQRLLPWAGRLEATEVESSSSLSELITSSDAVVRGRIVSVVPGRSFSGLTYAAATLEVDTVVAGAVADDSLVLEIPLFDGLESIDRLPDWGESLFFLRNKGTSAREAGLTPQRQREESRFNRLMAFGTIVVNDSGIALTDPDATLLADLSGAPFDEAVDIVRRAVD